MKRKLLCSNLCWRWHSSLTASNLQHQKWNNNDNTGCQLEQTVVLGVINSLKCANYAKSQTKCTKLKHKTYTWQNASNKQILILLLLNSCVSKHDERYCDGNLWFHNIEKNMTSSTLGCSNGLFTFKVILLFLLSRSVLTMTTNSVTR